MLDFDLFDADDAQRQQALWRFEMRDATQPEVSLGSVFPMNLIELKKADRLNKVSGRLNAWILFFKHLQDDLIMANIDYEPVKKAVSRIKALSADEEAQRLAFVRERALRDEVSFIKDATKRGRAEGLKASTPHRQAQRS